MIEVTKNHGIFTPDLHWKAELSNGETIFYDIRSDLEPAWIRLKKYVELNKLKIEKVILQFRSHIVELPTKAEGYFHVMGIAATIMMDGNGSWGGPSEDLWKFGILKDDKIHIAWFRVPEIEIIFSESKDVEKCKETLIRNNNVI